jgi:hypothetical protein
MRIITISVNYTLIWQHKEQTNYQWTKCGKLFNVKTGRQIKKVYNGGSIGYNIAGKFLTLTELRKQLVKIEDVYCPF